MAGININKIIIDTWTELMQLINNNTITCSSEKSLVFNFAWNLKTKLCNNNPSIECRIDFEKSDIFNFYPDESTNFLDLYIECDNNKIGIEFKFPRCSPNKTNRAKMNNSNQTDNRIKIIEDWKRILWLLHEDKIDKGFFFCITNEEAYTKPGVYSKYKDFEIYDGKVYDDSLPTSEISSLEFKLENDSPIMVSWNNSNESPYFDFYLDLSCTKITINNLKEPSR